VADEADSTIRRITPAGVVSTLAGHALVKGSTDGPGASALFNGPFGLAVDARGFLYVTDRLNNTIRVINPGGVVSTLAGQPGVAGSADGATSNARFNGPRGVVVDGGGNLYLADCGNRTIRKITSAGVVVTIGGLTGNAGNADGTGAAARFNGPDFLVLDSQGNIYVCDKFSHTIRKGVRRLVQHAATPGTTAATAPSPTTVTQPPSPGTVTNSAALNQLGWISSQVPKPGADGWIVLFDGKRLYGCTPSPGDLDSGKVSLQNDGTLRLDSTGLDFRLSCTNAVISARVRKMSGQNCYIAVRSNQRRGQELDDYEAWFNGGNFFGIGKTGEGKYKDLVGDHSKDSYGGFFQMEFRSEGENLTLKANDRTICEAADTSLIRGQFSVGAFKGVSLFESIKARVLDQH
jgi:sugar lactone lactonase YvrE